MKRCAYCDKEGKLTKEHIWPKGIVKRMPELEVKYLKSKKKFFSSELIISDVCADCNNIKLSILDNYLCKLYDLYFETYIEKEEEIIFNYDYDLLLRSLLKITYNTSRTENRNNNVFTQFREYILNGGRVYKNIIIRLDLISPSIVNGKKIYPKSARCGGVDIGINTDKFILRMISINSYYFYIIIYENDFLSDEDENKYYQIFHKMSGVIIHPYENEIKIKHTSNIDTHSAHIDFIRNTSNAFDKYISKNNIND